MSPLLPAGVFQGPDLCCREHDRCPHNVSPFQYNYGIRNYRFHTISHCNCDARLVVGREGRGLRVELPSGWVQRLELQRILKNQPARSHCTVGMLRPRRRGDPWTPNHLAGRDWVGTGGPLWPRDLSAISGAGSSSACRTRGTLSLTSWV